MSRLDRKGWNWAPVPADVILSSYLNHADVRVYAYLLWRAGGKNYAWPGADKIAEELKMSNASVRLAYRHLITDNWIKRLRRIGHTSITFVFETQKDCIAFRPSANLLADEQLTSEPTVSLPVSRVKESKKNENNNNSPAAEEFFKQFGRKRWKSPAERELFEETEATVGPEKMTAAVMWGATNGIARVTSICSAAKKWGENNRQSPAGKPRQFLPEGI